MEDIPLTQEMVCIISIMELLHILPNQWCSCGVGWHAKFTKKGGYI